MMEPFTEDDEPVFGPDVRLQEVANTDGSQWWFYCPGCRREHAFTMKGEYGWKFNSNIDKPTFTPSLLCDKDEPTRRCHLYLTDGIIHFLADCHHEMAGQSVELRSFADWVKYQSGTI